MSADTDAPDFCPEGCYWQCQHRTVEDRLRLAYAPSEATREALATIDEAGEIDWSKVSDPSTVERGGGVFPRFDASLHAAVDFGTDDPDAVIVFQGEKLVIDHHRDEIDQYVYRVVEPSEEENDG